MIHPSFEKSEAGSSDGEARFKESWRHLVGKRRELEYIIILRRQGGVLSWTLLEALVKNPNYPSFAKTAKLCLLHGQ